MALTPVTATSLLHRRGVSPGLALATGGGAAFCIGLTILLATGRLVGHGLTAVAAVAFLLVTAWCFASRRVDRTLIVLALYLGLLDGYVKLRTGSSTITLVRDALVLAIAAGALLRTVLRGGPLILPPLGLFVVGFAAVVLIEIANPGARGLAISFAGVRQDLEFLPLFFLGFAFLRTEAQIRKALWVVLFCAAVGGVVSYIQSTLTPAELATWGPGYHDRILGTGIFAGVGRTATLNGLATVRPFGLGSDAGSGAAAAALALPGLLALAMAGKGGGRGRWALLPISVGLGLAVATSGSRSAIVVAFVNLLAFGLISAASKNALKAVAGLAIGVALIYAAFVQLGPGNPTSQRARSITPSKIFSTFSSNRGHSVAAFGRLVTTYPLGAGLARVGPASSVGPAFSSGGLDAETEWNYLVIELGVAGVGLYIALLLRLMWLSITRIRRVPRASLRLYLAALAAPIFGMLAAGFSGPTSTSVPVAPYLWLVSGILAFFLVSAYRHQP